MSEMEKRERERKFLKPTQNFEGARGRRATALHAVTDKNSNYSLCGGLR